MFDFGVWIHRGLSQKDQVWSSGLVKQVWGAVAFCRGLGELAVAGQGADYGSVPAALLQNTLGLNRLGSLSLSLLLMSSTDLHYLWQFGHSALRQAEVLIMVPRQDWIQIRVTIPEMLLVNSYLRWDELPPGPLPPLSPEMPRCRLSGWCLDSSGSNY